MNAFANYSVENELDEFLSARETIENEIARKKMLLADINSSIRELVNDQIAAAYERAGKSGGTVNFAIGNRIYKCEIDKSVKWDTAILADIADELPPETLKITLSIEEKVFSNLDPVARSRVIAARTVRYSEPKIRPA